MDFRGGIIESDMQAGISGSLRITGGTINGSLLAFDQSIITVVGSGFNFPFGDVVPASGTLTGTLLDGTPIAVPFGRASTATITLVPEPSPALLLAVGLLALGAARRAHGRP